MSLEPLAPMQEDGMREEPGLEEGECLFRACDTSGVSLTKARQLTEFHTQMS